MAASAILSALPIHSFLLSHVRSPSLFSQGSSIKKAEFSRGERKKEMNSIRIMSKKKTDRNEHYNDLTVEIIEDVTEKMPLSKQSKVCDQKIQKKKKKKAMWLNTGG